MKSGVQILKDDAPKLIQRMESLSKRAAYVGIPEEKASRRGDPEINNAELLYIFTNGSPARNIPARPVIEPAIEYKPNADVISAELKQFTEATLDGNAARADRSLKRAAMEGQNAARAWFTNGANGWAPNAPSTIRRKGSSQPGIDTAQMRRAIIGITR